MKRNSLSEMTGGWFIGNFQPTLHNTNDFEVAVKRYKTGDVEKKHYHAIATEYTLIAEGSVTMNGQVFEKDDIITVFPGEAVEFKALTDVITVVVKTPSVKNDKYLSND